MIDVSRVRVFAYLLDGEGGGTPTSLAELESAGDAGFTWVQLDQRDEESQSWLAAQRLDPLVVDALLDSETRPRCTPLSKGLLVNLRAVNLNPGADPEDMVSLRIWIEARRAIVVRARRIMAIRDLRERIDEGHGPKNAGEFLVGLTDALADRMAGPIRDVDDAIDELEEEMLTGESHELRTRLGLVRRRAIGLHRYLGPQRDVMTRLSLATAAWLGDRDRARLQEVGDAVTRYVEDIESARGRAAVAQEELSSRLTEQTNRTMYLLTIVATIFLPLSLITGLLGVNVGGIPGAEAPEAFLILCGILGVIAVALFVVFKRKRIL